MSFQIRQSISSSVAGSSSEDLYAMVEDAIKKCNEHFLPGLGVLFKKWWQQAEPHLKQDAVKLLEKTFNN